MNILLVEDNPGDVRLTKEALKEAKFFENVKLSVVPDGEAAIHYLNRQGKYADADVPDLIFLDLNLPRKDGREVLKEIKEDKKLRVIPVVILTNSESEQDIQKSYDLHANCYITKPVDINRFFEVIKSIENFWFSIVQLPRQKL
ncbi:MAG: response regulator [Bacteroidia bacterium]|nr:response regulator [Bacteroidia bacterium]